MKFVYAILGFLVLAAAALFLVPPFLDWERFKPEITERLEAITGRALAIDGPIEVSILPAPEITMADLRIANAPGAAASELARIASLDLSLALGPLIGGEVAVTSMTMVEPVFELEHLADGRPNWLVESAAGAAAAGAGEGEVELEAGALKPTRIDSATITNGVIVVRHADGRPPERIEGIDAELSSRSLDGPYRGSGSLTLRGRPIAFQFATGTVGEARAIPVSLEASFGGERGSALFEGTVRGIDGSPTFDGSLRAQAADLGALLNALDVDRGALPAAPLASAFSAKGALDARIDAVAASDLQLRLGESQASGMVAWQGGSEPLLDAEITLNRIDLDRYLPSDGDAEAEPAGSEADGAAPAGATDAARVLRTIPEGIREALPENIAANVDLRIDTLTWREGVIRQARAQLALEGGAVRIRRASALLPGGAKVDLAGRLTAHGDGPWLESVAEVAADDLRAILAWLGVDVGDIPADRLRHLSASADLSAGVDRLAASNLDIRVDTTRIAGDVSFASGERPRLAAALHVDTVNVDAYLLSPVGTAAAAGEQAQEPAQETAQAAGAAREALAGIDADVALTIDGLTYDGVRLVGVELDAALDDGDLELRRARVADAVGASVSLTGDVRTVWTAPTVDLTVEGAADSLDGVAALLEIDPEIRAEAFGRISLQGSLAGDEDALEIDLALQAPASEASLQGTVERPFGAPAVALRFGLRASDAAALARTAGLTPPPVVERLGALAIDAGIGGELDNVTLDVSAEAAGATMKVFGRVRDILAAPDYSVAVDVSHPRTEALIETVAGEAPSGAALGALHIVGTAAGDRTEARIAGIDAAIGESTVSGKVSLHLDRQPPSFSAELSADALDLAWLGGGLVAASGADGEGAEAAEAGGGNAGAGPDGAALESGRWSDEPIDFAVLDLLSGTLSLDAEALTLGTMRIEQAALDLAAAAGTLTLRSLRGVLFGGALEADGSLAGGAAPTGTARFRLEDADLSALALKVAGVDTVSGSATVEGDVSLRGQTVREMVQSLAGRAAVSAGDGAIEGVDLPTISRHIGALAELDSLEDVASFIAATEGSLSSGRTAIRSLEGVVAVRDGQARTEGVRIVADGAVGDVAGSADLPAWQVDLTATFRLVEHPDAPPVGVRLQGPLDRPERRYLIEDMQAHLVRLGLLSLAGSPDMPKITIRKGAKAEPGTEMDTLLRDLFGDPEDAQEAAPAEAATGAGSPQGVGLEEQVDAPAEAAQPEEPAAAETEEVTQGADAEGALPAEAAEESAPPSADEPAPDAPPAVEPALEPAPAADPVPLPPPAPQRDRGDELRDFVDDLLKSLDE